MGCSALIFRDLIFFIYIAECPLNNHNQCQKRPRNFKGPYRVLRLCILGIVLPGILVAVPLYLRYHVYGYQLYPLAMSDMRMLDGKVSTTWCQVSLHTFCFLVINEKAKWKLRLKYRLYAYKYKQKYTIIQFSGNNTLLKTN